MKDVPLISAWQAAAVEEKYALIRYIYKICGQRLEFMFEFITWVLIREDDSGQKN